MQRSESSYASHRTSEKRSRSRPKATSAPNTASVASSYGTLEHLGLHLVELMEVAGSVGGDDHVTAGTHHPRQLGHTEPRIRQVVQHVVGDHSIERRASKGSA